MTSEAQIHAYYAWAVCDNLIYFLNEDMILAVVIAIIISNCKINPKKFRDFNGIRTHGLCSALAL